MRLAASSSPIPHLTFHIAVSASGKERKFRGYQNTHEFDSEARLPLGLEKGKSRRERRSGRPDSGQDAFFVAGVRGDDRATAFGIADGVGGWSSHGVDPADFSHGLCSHMSKAAATWSEGDLDPRSLMEIGYQATVEDPGITAGGSTACVGVAGAGGRLRIANLGDSGFLQLRLGAVQHKSKPQIHGFNTPYQLSITPPHILAQARMLGGIPLIDLPQKAEMMDHFLQHGDVLVLGTDGLWDNLNTRDVLRIVSNHMGYFGAWEQTPGKGFVVADGLLSMTRPGGLGTDRRYQTLQGVTAMAIAREAKTQSLNENRDGPFAREFQNNFPEERFHGGKMDDICVLLLIAVEHGRECGDHIRAQL